MATLHLKFLVRLNDSNLYDAPQGPFFHRWLPDGKVDAIELTTDDPDAKLEVWFERWGFVENKTIQFDLNRTEIDTEIMSKQGVVKAGPLVGNLTLQNIPDEDIVPIQKKEENNENYIKVGKRAVKKFIPLVSDFLNILQVVYGQYWIVPIEPWDSEKSSLGHYYLGMKYSQ